MELFLTALIIIVTYATIPESRPYIDPIFDSVSGSFTVGNGAGAEFAGVGVDVGVGNEWVQLFNEWL